MRLLANENFPLDAVAALRENGHDILWIRDEARGSNDEQVLARSARRSYFGNLRQRFWGVSLSLQALGS